MPAGAVSTGWPAVRNTCAQLGVSFDPWQHGAGRAILGKNEDGLYAADEVAMSIPRQVGKTYLIGWLIFALCIIQPKTLALWTAHRFPTARDVFDELSGIARNNRLLAPHVKRILTGSDNMSIEFRNGSKFYCGARERGFGRGFKRVGVLVFDEAQILGENAIDDMIPTTSTHPNPLIAFIGTPPKPSNNGEVFTRLRQEAIDGESDATLYIELSADEDADPRDRDQWAKANPSYPHRTSARSMLRMLKRLGIESFMREALGIWDGSQRLGVFGAGKWAKCYTAAAPLPPAALGIAADVDGAWLALGAASESTPMPVATWPHLGSVHRMRVDRRDEFVAEVKRIQSEHDIDVAVDKRGPASFLIPDLEAAGVRLIQAGSDDFIQACADMRDAVENGRISHGNYDDLNDAVDAATWRAIGERKVFGRKNGDIASLEAVTWALWATGDHGEPIIEPTVHFL